MLIGKSRTTNIQNGQSRRERAVTAKDQNPPQARVQAVRPADQVKLSHEVSQDQNERTSSSVSNLIGALNSDIGSVTYDGIDGDDQVNLQADRSRISLEGGTDIIRGSLGSEVSINKTDGEARFTTLRIGDPSEETPSVADIQLGEATARGNIRLQGDNSTFLSAGNFDNLVIQGSDGEQNLYLLLEEGASVPRVVGDRPDQTVLPEDWQTGDGVIYLDGIDSLLIASGDDVVGGFGY